jgi:hypothetical protein
MVAVLALAGAVPPLAHDRRACVAVAAAVRLVPVDTLVRQLLARVAEAQRVVTPEEHTSHANAVRRTRKQQQPQQQQQKQQQKQQKQHKRRARTTRRQTTFVISTDGGE